MLRFLPLLAVGCVTASNFNQQLSAVICERYEDCEGTAFEQDYSSQKDCRDDFEDFSTDCPQEHCEFDGKKANECLKDLRTDSCNDIDATAGACGEVWTDCDLVALAICLASEGFTFDTF